MAIDLVQVSRRKGRIARVPRGEAPLLELHLAENQEIVSVEFQEAILDSPERKTVDWRWTAYIATRL